jgi:hypothetical protein
VHAGPEVDLIVLSRDAAPLPSEVQKGIDSQVGVRLVVHRVTGEPRSGDSGRWETIARARNAGKRLGRAPWVMFLDDDVRLAPDAIDCLRRRLCEDRRYGALAADYLGESAGGGLTQHVGMGATLFRRAALELVTFRWGDGRCECQCCCDDLRGQGLGIRYWPVARAWHLKGAVASEDRSSPAARHPPPATAGRVLAAFDRRHAAKFRRRFLYSLRAAGNAEPVTAVAYGLYPSERAVLAAQPGVEVVALPTSDVLPPVRRLRDFQTILGGWPADTPVAYWDAGDVLFQARIAPLWETVRLYPDRLLAVREPHGHPRNRAVRAWTLSIADPQARGRAFELLSARPFLNSGFAAGTAWALLNYFREADRMLHSADLRGSTDWGDQTALNLYCHRNPGTWLEAEAGWNYCTHDRRRGEVLVRPDGRVASACGTPVHVVHGNAHSLRRLELFEV